MKISTIYNVHANISEEFCIYVPHQVIQSCNIQRRKILFAYSINLHLFQYIFYLNVQCIDDEHYTCIEKLL